MASWEENLKWTWVSKDLKIYRFKEILGKKGEN